jgi:hypothetical protein
VFSVTYELNDLCGVTTGCKLMLVRFCSTFISSEICLLDILVHICLLCWAMFVSYVGPCLLDCWAIFVRYIGPCLLCWVMFVRYVVPFLLDILGHV